MLQVQPIRFAKQHSLISPQAPLVQGDFIYGTPVAPTHTRFGNKNLTITVIGLVIALAAANYQESRKAFNLQQVTTGVAKSYAAQGLKVSPAQVKWTGLFTHYKGNVPITNKATQLLLDSSTVKDITQAWRFYTKAKDDDSTPELWTEEGKHYSMHWLEVYYPKEKLGTALREYHIGVSTNIFMGNQLRNLTKIGHSSR